MSHKLIIAEKPSVAQNIAHSIGAREKVYGSGSKSFCYANDEYYVVNAVGHLYGIGMPEDYGFKEWSLDTLPIFPDSFKVVPTDKSKDSIRSLISELINSPDVNEIICATDAGREGELIFRHIYNANNCTKPVKRLWINSVTDEAIREGMKNLKPISDYDNMYAAAFTREKLDWIIGMNLSRLYGIMDNYSHKIGRVKTPVLNIIVERDKEIESFVPSTHYNLLLPNGAESTESYESEEKAEEKISESKGKLVNVISVEKIEKSENRPLLYSLTTLQMDANDLYGFSADETLVLAQTLYEKKLLTYPRTDSEYISDDMQPIIENIIKTIADSPLGNSERAKNLLTQGLIFDKRVIDNSKIDDHHAIVITPQSPENISLSENEQKLYDLVTNRLFMALDKPHIYMEYIYEFWCEDVTYKLTFKRTTKAGWRAYRPKYEDDPEEAVDIPEYTEGSSFTAETISIKSITSKPKKHYTDKTLLSVMRNIDNRIEDKELKSAVSERGIGTSATRAEIIKQLVEAEYVERKGKQLISTEFGRKFIESLPDNVKSVERTAEWEQVFDNIQKKGISPDHLTEDVKAFVKTTIAYEHNRDRTPLYHENSKAPKREAIGICPRCGKQIFEGKTNFYCESGKDGCGFVVWKENKFYFTKITAEAMKKLLDGKTISLKTKNRDGETYTADYQLDDTGAYVNFKRIKAEKMPIGKCPRCGKHIFEGKSNYYCESGKDGCGFTLWKEDKFNGVTVTAKAAAELLSKGKATISKKTLNGTEKAVYRLVDTGKYINLKKGE
ncbi:MAG: type IA DNA topoisomerase [Oscillospiraceae bacterium]|nr:type IA DNA topoisomerase [Oscillospiraceae bacterium]